MKGTGVINPSLQAHVAFNLLTVAFESDLARFVVKGWGQLPVSSLPLGDSAPSTPKITCFLTPSYYCIPCLAVSYLYSAPTRATM